MRVLITGGAGYIGAVTAHLFVNAGHQVVAVDDLSTGHRENLPKAAKLVQGSILDKDLLEKVFSKNKLDTILNFAAKIRADESIKKPNEYIEVNFGGTANLLELAEAYRVSNFILASSAAVYGNTNQLPTSEDAPLDPINPYGISKMMAEQITEIFGQRDINWLALRFFNVAGAFSGIGPDPNSVVSLIPVLVRTLAAGIDFTVYKSAESTLDGTGTRDFVHVEDVARAHLLAAELMVERKQSIKTVVNIGGGQEHSILEIINLMERVTNKKLNYTLTAPRDGDPSRSVADINKAKLLLGWQPLHNIIDIVGDAWKWQLEQQ